jgi:hypothetical protein
MPCDEDWLDFPPATENHQMVAPLDGVVDYLPRDRKHRIAVTVDLNHIGMIRRASPHRGMAAGPGKEAGIRHPEHRQSTPAGLTQ